MATRNVIGDGFVRTRGMIGLSLETRMMVSVIDWSSNLRMFLVLAGGLQ